MYHFHFNLKYDDNSLSKRRKIKFSTTYENLSEFDGKLRQNAKMKRLLKSSKIILPTPKMAKNDNGHLIVYFKNMLRESYIVMNQLFLDLIGFDPNNETHWHEIHLNINNTIFVIDTQNNHMQTLIKLLNIDPHSLSSDESLSLLMVIELLIKNTVLFCVIN